ncbi:MAG: multicopper oxidase family protein [Alphaproteobacteria bacterium]|nr:multicopper oxidase family protein [Alphaproteobacteria bacterium]
MILRSLLSLSRRDLLQGTGAALALGAPALGALAAASAPQRIELVAAPGRAALVGPGHGVGTTDVWCYNGEVPGPVLRFRQGARARLVVTNRLDKPTTVHWHGLRVPNAMDGVGHLTQAPIAPGASFDYEFDLPDAGTFWYHPHVDSSAQVGRGLHGALIVEEAERHDVDRELVWVLGDWRLDQSAAIDPNFRHPMDLTHAGRIGNTVTLNGRVPEEVTVRQGERLRLRLINAANARIFALDFQGQSPMIVALDGHGVTPHAPADGRVVLAPAQRADLILDVPAMPSGRSSVIDRFYGAAQAYRLVDLVAERGTAISRAARPLIAPAANPLSEPDLARAERIEVKLGGGMMDPRFQRGEITREKLMEQMRHGLIWSINGQSVPDHGAGHRHDPLIRLARGRTYVLAMDNDTAWHHPMHLHGHTFRVVARHGVATEHREWRDTVLLDPAERVDIAFVADNPGDWMFHCHVLEHQAAGMMATIRVE